MFHVKYVILDLLSFGIYFLSLDIKLMSYEKRKKIK